MNKIAFIIALIAMCLIIGFNSKPQGIDEFDSGKYFSVAVIPPQLWKDCIAKFNGTAHDLRALAFYSLLTNQTRHVSCTMNCVFEALRLMNDGNLVENNLMQLLQQYDTNGNIGPAIKDCAAKKGADNCENALTFYGCFRKIVNQTALEMFMFKDLKSCAVMKEE